MDFLERCTSEEGSSVCMAGMLLGIIITLLLVCIIITLLLVWVYMTYMMPTKPEFFVDPNSLDATTKAILAAKNASDPPNNRAMMKMYGRM